MLIKQMTVGMMGVCCYIVACEKTKQGVIIDPGGNEDEILAACEDLGISVKYIVNTHGHPDHVCGNGRLKTATGAEIVMHADDAEFFNQKQVEQFFSQLGLPASPPVDKKVNDGDVISFGSESLSVILTPGHTPGGICLYGEPNLFTGDTLFAGGVGRTDFPGGDTKQLLNSIKDKLLKLPPDTIVWPGHGYGGERSTIAEEQKSNPFLSGSWF
jgi:glyoxylase-like metal-dependent hydrolase (beta-lactamase superfamily II)